MFFPRVEELAREAGEQAGLMSPNVDQHHLFEPGLVEMNGYAQDVLEGKKEFDSGTLRGLIEGFAEDLTRHLHDVCCCFVVGVGAERVAWEMYVQLADFSSLDARR